MFNGFHQKEDVLPRMRGMWADAFIKLCGVDKVHFNGKHGACMYCGGKDRARFSDKVSEAGDGGYICTQCGGDTGIGWFQRMRGETYSEAINTLGEYLNLVPVEVISKANKKASRTPLIMNVGAQVDHEACMKVMERTEMRESTPLSVYEGIGSEWYHVGVKALPGGSEEVFHTIPCRMVHQDGLDDEMCNILFIDSNGSQRFMARDYTRGSVCVTGNGDGSIYLVTDWIDAQHVHMATSQEVWCCFSPANLEIVAHRYKGPREMRVACLPGDNETLYMADDRSMKVIIPSGDHFKSGMQKRLYSPTDLLKLSNK